MMRRAIIAGAVYTVVWFATFAITTWVLSGCSDASPAPSEQSSSCEQLQECCTYILAGNAPASSAEGCQDAAAVGVEETCQNALAKLVQDSDCPARFLQ